MVRSTIRAGVRDFWQFYRGYTDTAIHTASAAALAIFGLLVFIDPWFVLVAIGSYVLPPVVLYLIRGTEPTNDTVAEPDRNRRSQVESVPDRPGQHRSERIDGRNVRDGTAESNVEDGDTDSDTDDGDTDADRRGSDTDSDSDT